MNIDAAFSKWVNEMKTKIDNELEFCQGKVSMNSFIWNEKWLNTTFYY